MTHRKSIAVIVGVLMIVAGATMFLSGQGSPADEDSPGVMAHTPSEPAVATDTSTASPSDSSPETATDTDLSSTDTRTDTDLSTPTSPETQPDRVEMGRSLTDEPDAESGGSGESNAV